MRKKGGGIIICGILFCIISALFSGAEQKKYQIEFTEKARIGSEDKREELFFNISDVKTDAQGNIFILDSSNNCVRKFSKDHKFLSEAGRQGQGPGDMNSPSALAIDLGGNVFIADNGNMRINLFDNNLVYLTSIKLIESMSIRKIFIDGKGNLIVFRVPKLKDDSFFCLFSSEGVFLKSFFYEFHPFAPKMNSLKELRNNFSSLTYMGAVATLNQDRAKIAFSYDVPENPLVIYLMDTEGNIKRTIQKPIKGFDPKKQRKDIESVVLKNTIHLQGTHVLSYIRSLHFAEDGNLVLQRYDQVYKDGKPIDFKTYLDFFSPDGNPIFEGKEFPGEIISIDSNNNVYACPSENHERNQVVIYSLRIKK